MFNPLRIFRRTKVGLALGSGGAKGVAHIAVIEYLEQRNIKIDMIAGASAGALVGAIYCSGNLQKFKSDLLNLSKKDFISFFEPVLPISGLVGTDRMMKWISNYIPADINIEDLPIPLSVAATDYYSGRPVIFNSGNLLSAVRASISIPGIFTPVKYEDTVLIDGGVTVPLPVDIVRKMGADVTIAVNLHPYLKPRELKKELKKRSFEKTGSGPLQKDSIPLKERAKALGINTDSSFMQSIASFMEKRRADDAPKEKLPTIFESIMQTIDIMELMNTQMMLTYEKPDLLIEPNLLHLGSLEFNRAEEALAEGRRSCEAVSGKLSMKIKLRL